MLVLQDGDRAGDLSSAAPDHGVSIDPLTAQRVEVVRGPASLLYGNQALGGVVNVISNDIPTSIPTTGGVVYRGYKFDYGLPSGEGERAKIDGHRHEVVGRSDITLNAGALTSLRVSGTAQWHTHAEIDQGTGNVNTSFDLETQTLDLLARTRAGLTSGAVGASGLFKQYGATGEEALTPAANSNGFGVFAFQEIALGAATADPDARVPKLQVGGRVDSYRIDVKAGGDEKFDRFVGTHTYNQFSGSVGLSVPVGSHAVLAGSAARSFRAPSVEELSSNAHHEATGTFDVGNPGLEAENNQGVDGILRVEGRGVTGQFSAFYNDITNYITPNIVGDTLVEGESIPLNRVSQADATLKGVEGRLEVEVVPHLVLGGMGDVVRGEFKDSKTPLPFMPSARLGGLARWDNGKFSLTGEYRHGFKRDRVPPAVSEDDPAGLATSSFDLLDLSAGVNLTVNGRINSIVLRVDNALDERYADATSRIKTFALNPGRNVALVYKLFF